jgi:hypothetical protein
MKATLSSLQGRNSTADFFQPFSFKDAQRTVAEENFSDREWVGRDGYPK